MDDPMSSFPEYSLDGLGFKKREERLRLSNVRGMSLTILQLLLKHKTLTASEISELLHANISTVRVYMWRLRKYGLIAVSSTYNYYYYSLTEKAYELLSKLKQSNNDFEYHVPLNRVNTLNTLNRVNTLNTLNTLNSLNNNNHHTSFDIKFLTESVKNAYKLSDSAAVVVEVLLTNYIQSRCRRKYVRFTESYQLETEFNIKLEDIKDALRELEKRGIIYIYTSKNTVKIGLMQGFVEELEEAGLRCS